MRLDTVELWKLRADPGRGSKVNLKNRKTSVRTNIPVAGVGRAAYESVDALINAMGTRCGMV